jgi:hypothetical protein
MKSELTRDYRRRMWVGDVLTGLALVGFIVLFWILGEVLRG